MELKKKKKHNQFIFTTPKNEESKSNWKPQRGVRSNLNRKGGQESPLGGGDI